MSTEETLEPVQASLAEEKQEKISLLIKLKNLLKQKIQN